MMNKKQVLAFLSLFLLLGFVPNGVMSSNSDINLDSSHEPALTIYTYESLLADPGYAFDRAFEEFAGLANGSVEVVLLEDAGSIVTKAASEKADPVADVLIGIDNVLVNQAREQNILTPYQPNGTEHLVDGLVDGLASDYLLTPYDYGVISLYYLQNEFTNTIDINSFTMEDLRDPDFQKQLIVENPQLSSPGLGFLLSTIAMFGDENGVDSLIDGDWKEFWRSIASNTRLTSSWGDAFSLLYDTSRSVMVSYSTSPAYGACLYDDYSTTALLPTYNDTTYGWQQIEGLGLVNGAKNEELAKQFIDWFISEELQAEVHQNQWMYPARQNITAPDCYDAAIDPSTITPLNSRISQDVLETNLDNWLQEWEVEWVEGSATEGGLDFNPLYLLATLVILPIIRKRKK